MVGISISSIAIWAASLLGVLYVALGLAALSHIGEENKPLLSNRWPVFFFWWPFYGDLYRDSGSKLRLYGKLIFLMMVVSYVVWMAQPE